ncbi:MAG: FHA domain-containing protein [Pirellulales bacterium]
MPAKLLITDGPSAGEELWIEYEVLRLGSDASCELIVADPAVEPHALTIRYGDGKYVVYNRGSSPLTLDSLTIAPSESGPWRSGKSLKFPGGLVLKLETSGDGAPSRRPAEAYVPPVPLDVDASVAVSAAASDADKPGDQPTKEKSNTPAILVGVLFAAAAVFVLFSDSFLPSDAKTSAESVLPEFPEMVSMLQKEPACAPDLWVMLSRAHAEAFRGDTDRAAAEYRRLRDRIVWEKNLLLTEGKPLPEALVQAEAYVREQITPGL